MTLRFLATLSCIFFLFCHSFVNAEGFAGKKSTGEQEVTLPDRDIKYVEENTLPGWKVDWDQARDLYRQGKIGQALVQYELLLQKKSTVDEARWEYTTLLMQQKRWQQAGKELDTLLAREPEKQKFLFARASVFLEEGLCEQAVKIYGQLYERDPVGDDALEALAGLIAALDKQGDREAQLPLLEQLLLRKSNDLSLVKQIASLALELGRAEKTIEILRNPLKEYPRDVELLRLVARAQDSLCNRDQAADAWQLLVALVPDDAQANQWLANYYQLKGNFEMALIHVERQLKLDPGDVELILVASRLHSQMNHLGQALDYQNFYLDLAPDDQKVIEERDQTREVLATDLIALVEHRKVDLLWQDLEQVTSDRAGVYLKMADLLRTQRKEKELTEVLLLIHQYYPDDRQLYLELASLLEGQERSDELEKLNHR